MACSTWAGSRCRSGALRRDGVDGPDRDGEGVPVRLAPGVTPAATEAEAEAEDMARTVNDVGAELANDRPDRFGFLATVPLPAVDAVAREATRPLDELGADGRGEGESFPCNRALPAAIGVHDEPRALRLTGPAQQRHRLRGC